MTRHGPGRLLLTASCGDFMVRKNVLSDGRTDVVITRNGDLVSLVSAPTTISVTHGRPSVIVNVIGGHNDQLARARALLLRSPAAAGLRTLATVLEEAGIDAPERMGVRLTGALLAQLDGDVGAIRRLSRERQARYEGSARPTRRHVRADGFEAYQAGVMKAANDLETCLGSFQFVNPMRYVSSFVWVNQVERLWFAYVSRASMPQQ